MKVLLILRHAKSSWKDADLADHDRPLNKRGKRDVPRMGKILLDENLVPDLILSSSAKRAHKTAQLVAEECRYEGEIKLSRDLYATGPEAYIEALSTLPDQYERVMVVGHNPGLEELLEELTGQAEALPTAALAQIELPIERWQEISASPEGELIQVWRPRETS